MSAPAPRPNSHRGRGSARAAPQTASTSAPSSATGTAVRAAGGGFSGIRAQRADRSGFDLDQQVLAADVRLQVDGLGGRAERGGELGLNDRQVRGAAHVDLAGEVTELEAGAARHAVRFPEQRFDVGERLARLGGRIPDVERAVADDARRPRDEECEPPELARERRARERRAVSAVLRGIVISAHLPGVLDEGRRGAPGEEVHDDRTVARGAKGGGRRHAALERPPTLAQRMLAGGVELAVAPPARRGPVYWWAG